VTAFTLLDDHTPWHTDVDRRRLAFYTAAGLGAAAAERMLQGARGDAGDWTVAGITDAGTRAGYVAVAVTDAADGARVGRIGDLHVDEAHTGRGHERAAREWAEEWCARRGASRVETRLAEPAGELFAGYRVCGQLRARRLGSPAMSPADVTARPMTPDEFPDWLEAEKAAYVFDIVRAGALSPEEAAHKSDRDFAGLIPDGLATPDHAFLVLEAAGEPIGTGWLRHGHLPGVTYGYSLHVQEQHRGRGFGRAAMAAGEQVARAAGDDVLMFTVWGGNDVAMGLYTSAGYQVVEESRSADVTRPAAEGV
jgi:ribosomal protein S18 acetylase RimI-like enzyme